MDKARWRLDILEIADIPKQLVTIEAAPAPATMKHVLQ